MPLSQFLTTPMAAFLSARRAGEESKARQLQEAVQISNMRRAQEEMALRRETAGRNQQLLDMQLEKFRQEQEAKGQLDKLISTLPPQMQPLARLNPEAFVAAQLRNKSEKPTIVPPSHTVLKPDTYEPIYTAPGKPDPFAQVLDAAGITDPVRRQKAFEALVSKKTTHAPGTNIYSTALTPAVNARGESVYIQPSGKADVPPREVPGYKPPPKVSSAAANVILGEYQTAEKLIDELILQIKGSGRVPNVGIPGQAKQTYEAAVGMVRPNMPTPAINVETNKAALIAVVKALAAKKESNMSDKDVRDLEASLGFSGSAVTTNSAIKALLKQKEILQNRRSSFSVEIGGGNRGQAKYQVGTVYVDKNGNKAIYRGPGNTPEWEEVR